MNAAARNALAEIPIVVEEGHPVRVVVALREGGWYTAWARDGGRRKEPFGQPYATAREAAAAARLLNERGRP